MAVMLRTWRTFIVAMAVAGIAVGYMESDRRQAAAALANLDNRVTEASRHVNALRGREQKALAAIESTAGLESRLLNLDEGAYYRLHLEAMLDAARVSGAQLDRLTFAPAPAAGLVQAGIISGTVTGTEAQVLAFFQQLEDGAPLGQTDTVSWQIPLEPGADSARMSGSASFQVSLYGPLGQATGIKP